MVLQIKQGGYLMDIIDRIQAEMIKQQMTYHELADKSGLSYTTVALFMTKKTKPQSKTVGKLIKALNMEV